MSLRYDVALVAHVACPHGGYLHLFEEYRGASLHVLDEEVIADFPALLRNVPRVAAAQVVDMIRALDIFESVNLIGKEGLRALSGCHVVMPDEDISHVIAGIFLPHDEVTFDGSWRLRYDWKTMHHQKPPEGEVAITEDELHVALMGAAFKESERSPDWWRQVGAVLARDGEILLTAYNAHMPTEHSLYIFGDPRSQFNAGERIDMSAALHAEVGIIAAAASRGISMQGCDLYVTTFPCPSCAYACAASGIRRLFYRDGYSLIAGEETLRSRGIELIRVQTKTPSP